MKYLIGHLADVFEGFHQDIHAHIHLLFVFHFGHICSKHLLYFDHIAGHDHGIVVVLQQPDLVERGIEDEREGVGLVVLQTTVEMFALIIGK